MVRVCVCGYSGHGNAWVYQRLDLNLFFLSVSCYGKNTILTVSVTVNACHSFF